MLYEAYVQGIFKETVQDLILKNKSKYGIKEDYYNGYHWSIGGITTRAGMAVVNERKKGHIYYGVVDNKIKDSIDTIVSLVYGLNGVKVTESDLVDINWEETIDKITYQIVKFDRCFYTLGKTTEDKITIKVLDTEDCHYVKDKEGNITEFVVIKGKEDNLKVKTWDIQSSTVIYREYEYESLQTEEILNINPVWEIEGDFDYLESLIPLQDVINAMKTQEFEINKFTGDPLNVLKGVKLMDAKGKQIDPRDLNLNSGSIISLGTEGSIERISGEGVTQGFLDALDREEKTFYKLAKLNGLRNDDLSGLTSGYAIQLKLIDTISFVKKIRSKIANGLKPVMNIIDSINGSEPFTLTFGNVIETGLIEKITEAKELKSLGVYTDEEIKTYIGV